jgi:hypothetical protein
MAIGVLRKYPVRYWHPTGAEWGATGSLIQAGFTKDRWSFKVRVVRNRLYPVSHFFLQQTSGTNGLTGSQKPTASPTSLYPQVFKKLRTSPQFQPTLGFERVTPGHRDEPPVLTPKLPKLSYSLIEGAIW